MRSFWVFGLPLVSLALLAPTSSLSQTTVPEDEIQVVDTDLFGRVNQEWDKYKDQLRHQRFKERITVKISDQIGIAVVGSHEKLHAKDVFNDSDKVLRNSGDDPDLGHWVRFGLDGRIGADFPTTVPIGPLSLTLGATPFAERHWTFEVRTGDREERNLAKALWNGLERIPGGAKYVTYFPRAAEKALERLVPGETISIDTEEGVTMSAGVSLNQGPFTLGAGTYLLSRGRTITTLKRLAGASLFRLRTVNSETSIRQTGQSAGVGLGLQLVKFKGLESKLEVTLISLNRQHITSEPIVFDAIFDVSKTAARDALSSALRDNWVPAERLEALGTGVKFLQSSSESVNTRIRTIASGFQIGSGVRLKNISFHHTYRPGHLFYTSTRETESDTSYVKDGDQHFLTSYNYFKESGPLLWQNWLLHPKTTSIKSQVYEEEIVSEGPDTSTSKIFKRDKLIYRFEQEGGSIEAFLQKVFPIVHPTSSVEWESLLEAKKRGEISKLKWFRVDGHFYDGAIRNIANADEPYVWLTLAKLLEIPTPIRWRYEKTREEMREKAEQELIRPRNAGKDLEARKLLAKLRKAEKFMRGWKTLATAKQAPREEQARLLRDLLGSFGHQFLAFQTLASLANQDDNPAKNSRDATYAEGLDLSFTFVCQDSKKKEVVITFRHAGADPARRTAPEIAFPSDL